MPLCPSPSVYGCRDGKPATSSEVPPKLSPWTVRALGEEPVDDAALVEDLDRP